MTVDILFTLPLPGIFVISMLDLLIQGFLSLRVFCFRSYYTNIHVRHRMVSFLLILVSGFSTIWKPAVLFNENISLQWNVSRLAVEPAFLTSILTVLLLSVGYNKMFKTKLSCGSSLCVSLLCVCICKEDALWQNGTWCQLKCRAGRVSVEGREPLSALTLTGRAAVGCSVRPFPVVEALRGRQCGLRPISGGGVFISRLQSMVFTTPNCKLRLNVAHFLKTVFSQRDLSTWSWQITSRTHQQMSMAVRKRHLVI